MAVAIVDELEVVDVDESEHEATVGTAGAVDLIGERLATELTTVRARELIEMCTIQLRLKPGSFPRGRRSIRCGAGSVGRRSDAIGSCLGRQCLEPPDQQRLVLVDGRGSVGIGVQQGLASRVALIGHVIAVGRRVVPVAGRARTLAACPLALDRDRETLGARRVVRSVFVGCVGVRRMFAVGDGLIVIRGALVARRAG